MRDHDQIAPGARPADGPPPGSRAPASRPSFRRPAPRRAPAPPESADQVGVPGLGLGEAQSLPCAEVDLAQIREGRQASPGRKHLGRGAGARQIRRDHRRVGRQASAEPGDGRKVATGRRAGRSSRSSPGHGSGRGAPTTAASRQRALQREAAGRPSPPPRDRPAPPVAGSAGPAHRGIAAPARCPARCPSRPRSIRPRQAAGRQPAPPAVPRLRPRDRGSASIWLVSHSVAQSTRTAQPGGTSASAAARSSGASQRGPAGAAIRPVLCDARAHLVVPGLGGGDVDGGAIPWKRPVFRQRPICPDRAPPRTSADFQPAGHRD